MQVWGSVMSKNKERKKAAKLAKKTGKQGLRASAVYRPPKGAKVLDVVVVGAGGGGSK